MSTINKLTIRGVRSFGTGPNDEQKITFSSPLTLILGENGCGKTTIIECLKYALSGEFPPGANKGQSFVHDPKIFNVSECLGQVKLEVKNHKNDSFTVCRSMKTSVVKRAGANPLKFETLDSTIHIVKDGKSESISHRCADINVEMAHIMGVSKAIINNVLFCHQEDSSWPLDEAKKLKERFDSIFGTSEYNKAIEKIIKLRKSYDVDAKQKDAELKILVHLKRDAEYKNLDLEKGETKLAALKKTFDKCEEDLVPIKDRLTKIRTIELEISKLYTQKTEVATKLAKCKDHQSSLTAKIKTIFDGSFLQLDRELRTFRERTEEKKILLRNQEDSLAGIKIQEKRIQSQLSEMDRKRSGLIFQRQQEQEFSSERAKIVQDLCQRLGVIVNIDLDNTNDSIDDVLSEIRDAFRREDTVVSDLSKSHDKLDQDLQTAIDKLRENRATVETDVASKRKQVADCKSEQSKNQFKIDSVEKSAQALKVLTVELAKVDKVYQEYSKDLNLEADKKRIADKRIRRNQLQEQLDSIDEQITFLNSISNITAEIQIKENQLEQRDTEARKVRSKHSDNLKRLLNNQTIESNFKRRVQTVYQNMQRDIGELNKSIAKNQQTITELQLTRKNQKDEQNRAEKELTEADEKIYEQCHSTPFIEVLERVKETVAKYQLDHGALKASDVLYKKYMKKMEEDPCCPLCHKDMSGSEVQDLTSEMLDEIRRLPENIERTERLLKLEQRKYEQLLALQPLTERIEKLKLDIPKLKQNLKQTEERLSSALTDSETFQISLAEPTSNMELANTMLGDMSLLDEAFKDIERIRQELTVLRAKMPERTTALTMEVAQQQRTTVGADLKSERSEIDQLQAKYDENVEMVNTVREKRNKMKDQQIQLQEGIQALSQLKQRQHEIVQQIDKFLLEINALEAKLGPLKTELRQAMDNKQQSKDRNRMKLNEETQKLNAMKRQDTEIKRFTEELKKLSELNLVEQIEHLKSSLKKYMDDQKQKAIENEQTTAQIEQLNKDIAGQAVIERDLIDNKELKMLQSEQEELQQQLDTLSKDMSDHDFNSVSREKEGLVKKQDAIIEKRSEYVGQMGELKSQIKRIETELNQPKYREAIKNYRQAYYDYMMLRKIVTDLGTYRIALEWALMKYHSEKMEKINRIIKGLWHSIYRGNDIDYIQIKTDEMKATNADKKRSYDYRVVQIKNDSELDMRGRCSAGQRVLACLIIRIALAETFSSNCGVLALDEPTTNLDRVNILSLCEALNKIVEDRQSQTSFMLLVITHDEDFITTLGRIENYWKISRDTTGKSLIQKVRVQ